MALASGTLFNVQSTATSGNVNGAGFNTANTNFATDWTVDSGTGNTSAPVISSATISLAAGDATAWIYVKAGTNWATGTWFPITSISGGKATINAAIGAGFKQDANNPAVFTATTVAGIATTGTPTGGTLGFDFSMADSAVVNLTNFAQLDGDTLLTSASNPFRRTMSGNMINLTTTGGGFGVVGRYEVANYVSAGGVNLDRYQSIGDVVTGQTGYLGGAGNWNAGSTVDSFMEELPPASQVWIKNGTYTLSAALSVAASPGTPTTPNWIIGYNSLRGDTCTGSSRPLIAAGANAISLSAETNVSNVRFTSTAASSVQVGANSTIDNCSVINTSSTAGRTAWLLNVQGIRFTDCEGVSANGSAWSSASGAPLRLIGCYAHDSDLGFVSTTGVITAVGCKVENCRTAGFDTAGTGTNQYINCTIYGTEAKQGIGCRFTGASSTGHQIAGCIIYGWTTGVSCSTKQGIDQDLVNNYYNNTTDVSNWIKDGHSIALDPQFAGAAQITGTTATTSGSTLTQSGGDFSTVTDNVDFVYVVSGTGVTVGRYLITGHTSTTLTTNNALGTSSAGNVVYYIGTGHNHTIGTNLKGLGPCNFSNMSNAEDRSYLDLGCMQRQEAAASGGLFRPATFTGGFAQ